MTIVNKIFILCSVALAILSMSIMTNLSGIVIPFAKDSMNLSLSQTGVLPFSFFIAYAVMSLPAGCINEKRSAKSMMLTAFAFTALAYFLFLLAPSYEILLFALFVSGAGMAVVQVVINPLVRNVGGEEYFSFYLIFGQFLYGAGSVASPLLFTSLISKINSPGNAGEIISFIKKVTPEGLPWISIYWVCFISCIIVLILLLVIAFPKIQMSSKDKIGGFRTLFVLLKDYRVWIFFFGIFFYAGTEQGVSNWMTKFFQTYHGIDPESAGAAILSKFWLCISLGGGLGVIMVFLMDVRKLLGSFSVISIILLAVSLFGSSGIAVWTFPLCGLFFAIMYPSILSLGMNTILEHHGALSGLLCTGICGAAVIALMIGFLGDFIGLRWAMCIIFAPLLYVLFISFWAKPIIKNRKLF